MSSSVRLSVCRVSVVCCLFVTFVHPSQAIEIFGNVSTPFGTLAICDLLIKILRRSSQGNPSVGWLNRKGIATYSDIALTNRKSHMRFRLVPKWVTLNNLERRNSRNLCVMSPNSVAFGTNYLKVVEDTLILSAAEM